LALLEKLRETQPDLEGIAVSGNAMPLDVVKSKEAGYLARFTKSVSPPSWMKPFGKSIIRSERSRESTICKYTLRSAAFRAILAARVVSEESRHSDLRRRRRSATTRSDHHAATTATNATQICFFSACPHTASIGSPAHS
jgi:hypothetical protein